MRKGEHGHPVSAAQLPAAIGPNRVSARPSGPLPPPLRGPLGRQRPAREERRPRWKPRKWRRRLLITLLSLSGAVVLAITVAAIIAIVHRGGSGFLGLDSRCQDAAFSCGIVGGLLISIVPIVVAVLTLLLWRLSYIRRRYRRRAQDTPQQLVETAVSDYVVGRKGLCDVLQGNLQDRDHRRPQLLVGGVGVGKTAVLVRLTRLLAARGAVPVPIRLRDASKELDFMTLARERFLDEVEQSLLSETEGDKIWRKLLEEDRIIVLGDGLEEALIAGGAERSRDSAIRLAFAAAQRDQLPLIVTSRPHAAVRYVEAATLPLEPLSEGAALGFIYAAAADADRHVRSIVETAEVVEAPLYMQIARALHGRGLLPDLDPTPTRRLALRMALLDGWRQALIDGQLSPEAPYAPTDRERSFSDLEALACVGLAADSLEVTFEDLDAHARARTKQEGTPDFRGVLAGGCSDLRFAATVGGRLDVVEPKSAGVRFRHSIVQAYLGSRSLERLLGGASDFLHTALADPGREALMALVMFCSREQNQHHRVPVRDALLGSSLTRNDAKAIDLMAAAVEIDSLVDDRHDDWIDQRVESVWAPSRDQDTEEAKLRAVARLGEGGRRGDPPGRRPADGRSVDPAARSHHAQTQDRQDDTYRALWHICLREPTYSVRLAAAQEIAAGGSAAFAALHPVFQQALEAGKRTYAGAYHDLTPQLQRELALQGWILPTLTTSVGAQHADAAGRLVTAWIELLSTERSYHSIEASWGQGFKYEANRRPSCVDPEMRALVTQQAERLAQTAHLWFSRICLLHAFTLWLLRDPALDAGTGVREHDGAGRSKRRALRERREWARRTVEGWDIDRSHPLVAEAHALCELALRSDRPARYVWIDEAGVVSKLGPKQAAPSDIGNSRLWISPAAGWLSLGERASQLVGEIVVLLNLADNRDPATAEPRLGRVLTELPPCMTKPGDRRNLQVDGSETMGGPGGASTCGCPADLCPYPPPGHELYRGELSEAFCREQLRLVKRPQRRIAPWQRAQSPRELKDFWTQMETRAGL
jgi:hypothetical protein